MATTAARRGGRRRFGATAGMLRAWMVAARRAESGVAALEFALFAPVLFFGLVATADVGLALYERMTLDHALRAGAQSAMGDPGKDAVLGVLSATAAKNFPPASPDAAALPSQLVLSVDRYCTCSGDTATAVACSTTCPGTASTYIYYRLAAAITRDSMILPDISFSPSLQVQVQ